MQDDRWRDIGMGYGMVLDEPTKRLDVELFHEDCCDAEEHGEMNQTDQT